MNNLSVELRRQLLDKLDSCTDVSDDQILSMIDEMVLEAGKTKDLPLAEMEDLRRSLFCSVRRLDVLQDLLDDPEITEIMVNGYRHIFYEKHGKIREWDHCFESKMRLEDVIQQIAGWCNRVVNEQRPIADARLPDGSRVNIVMDPVAIDGPVVTIRRFPEEPIRMEDLVRLGSLTVEAADFLKDLVEARYAILVGGGTSTGKTTFLNALTAYIPESERVLTIEDNAELQIQRVRNLVRMEARSANLEDAHEITIRDLIKTALRMRPDRGRIEVMVLMSNEELPIPVIRRQIASGVEILVHLSRDAAGARQLSEIAEITGMDGNEVQIHTLFARDQEGVLRKKNTLTRTGKLEKLYERKGGKYQR